MPRHIEIIFMRHGEKFKDPAQKDPEQLTEKGREQARQRGREIKERDARGGRNIKTYFLSSRRDRTRDTVRHVGEGMEIPNAKVHQWTQFDFNKPPRARQTGSDFEEAYAKHGANVAFSQWMKGKFDPNKGAIPEQVGVQMLLPLRHAWKLSQGKGEPLRFVIGSHGGSNLETAFYALTGVNPTSIKGKSPITGKKGKGTMDFTEGFRIVMNGPVMSVHFRGKRFKVQRAILPVLRAMQNRTPAHRAVEEQLFARRKRLLEQEARKQSVVSKKRFPAKRRRK